MEVVSCVHCRMAARLPAGSLKSARALGIAILPSMIAIADQVIE